MTASSNLFDVIAAVLWFGVGFSAIIMALRHRRYFNSLPPTAGNLRVKRENRMWLIAGVVMIAVGAWNTFVRLR
jgi:hypothetical protein